MGRSRVIPHIAQEDLNNRASKRKKTVSTVEILDPTSTGGRGSTSDGKGGALYHCNYCNKDISGKIRIKCAVCFDFDLCIECFSVGAEITPHKSNHSYRVMDNLSFPFICPDWNADEEILLLEGIEMYGLGNWMEVSEHVGTKSKSQCINHYNTTYINSPCFPLPDMSHVMGKSREELLAMAKELGEVHKGSEVLEEITNKEESPFSTKVEVEEYRNEGPVGRSSSSLTSGVGSPSPSMGSSGGKSLAAVKKASNIALAHLKDGCDKVKVEDRSVGEKKPRMAGEEGPSSMKELSCFNFKRQEFENEYDNDAELLLSDMEFKKSDTDAEHELKLGVLRIYNKRLEERKRRKAFILERNLLYPDPFEKNLSPKERELCQKYKVFMRFHSKEEHEEFLRTIIEEYRIRQKIQDLQEARAGGCQTSVEAQRFAEQKRKKQGEEMARKIKESSQGQAAAAAASPKFLLRTTPPQVDSSSSITTTALVVDGDVWDMNGFVGADLLCESEKQMCSEMRILPSHYLSMLQTISMGIINGNITQKCDAHKLLLMVESSKIDRIYDKLLKKQIAPMNGLEE